MPKPVKISRYPGTYFDIAERLETMDSVTITCRDEIAAKSLRFDLYGFRKAIDKEGLEMYAAFRRASIKLIGNQLVLSSPELNVVDFQIEGSTRMKPPGFIDRSKPGFVDQLPGEFSPSLADAPPSSTYQGTAVVKEFEDLIDAWMGSEPPKE